MENSSEDTNMYDCCEQPLLCKNGSELICKNCGETFDCDELNIPELNDKNTYNNNCIKILYKNNNVKKIYINDSDSYKYIRYNTLLNFLKDKNKQSADKIHENILKQCVENYIKITENKILRANNRIECLSYILFRKCIDFNNPKTLTFIVNYMGLPKGGFSRGFKRINLLLNDENKENENNNILLNENDDLIKLKSYTEKMILIDFDNSSIDIENIFPVVIKLYNFTNKLGVFNEFRNDTKITGCIWYIIKLKELKINNAFFKKNKIEKNTVKKFYKKICDSMYNPYYVTLINNEFIKFKN
tara:strand:+ start:10106 stop:11011 length:906 start_codon:yes stop_codon:yes gene_type:complete